MQSAYARCLYPAPRMRQADLIFLAAKAHRFNAAAPTRVQFLRKGRQFTRGVSGKDRPDLHGVAAAHILPDPAAAGIDGIVQVGGKVNESQGSSSIKG